MKILGQLVSVVFLVGSVAVSVGANQSDEKVPLVDVLLQEVENNLSQVKLQDSAVRWHMCDGQPFNISYLRAVASGVLKDSIELPLSPKTNLRHKVVIGTKSLSLDLKLSLGEEKNAFKSFSIDDVDLFSIPSGCQDYEREEINAVLNLSSPGKDHALIKYFLPQFGDSEFKISRLEGRGVLVGGYIKVAVGGKGLLLALDEYTAEEVDQEANFLVLLSFNLDPQKGEPKFSIEGAFMSGDKVYNKLEDFDPPVEKPAVKAEKSVSLEEAPSDKEVFWVEVAGEMSTSAEYPVGEVKVRVSALSKRTGPSIESEKTGVVLEGDRLAVFESSGSWVKVKKVSEDEKLSGEFFWVNGSSQYVDGAQ